MSRPISLAHIVFRTNDLQRMRDWYVCVLEAEVVFENERIAFLTYDDEHHRIALVASGQFAERPKNTSVGFYHAAFAYKDLNQLLENYDRLKAEGVIPFRTINHGMTISFYYADPDGNELEFQVDRFAKAAEAYEWMQGEAFSANPIGVEFNPEELRKRIKSGEPVETIMRRADEHVV